MMDYFPMEIGIVIPGVRGKKHPPTYLAKQTNLNGTILSFVRRPPSL
jgi:hypothetical protein